MSCDIGEVMERLENERNVVYSTPVFLKLWSADHLWSSRSARVVLRKKQKKK